MVQKPTWLQIAYIKLCIQIMHTKRPKIELIVNKKGLVSFGPYYVRSYHIIWFIWSIWWAIETLTIIYGHQFDINFNGIMKGLSSYFWIIHKHTELTSNSSIIRLVTFWSVKFGNIQLKKVWISSNDRGQSTVPESLYKQPHLR